MATLNFPPTTLLKMTRRGPSPTHLQRSLPALSSAIDPQLLTIAFDGECLMCSRSIRFLAVHDPRELLRFTRLQDPTGQQMISQAGTAPLDSVIVRQHGRLLTHSDAILAILSALGGPWKILALVGKLIPRPLRDALYRFIARHRYQWFGKGDACSLPTPALQKRLLPYGEGS